MAPDILKRYDFVTLFDNLVHILHRVNGAHFSALLTPGFNACAAGIDPAPCFKEFIGLLDSIKLLSADILILNAFAHEENLDLILLPDRKIRIPERIPACFCIIA